VPIARTLANIGACLGLLGSAHAMAGDDYRCTIERVAHSHANAASQLEFLKKTYVGRQFTVERRTGLMAGALKNSFVTSPQVVDVGSKDNSFKVVTTLRLDQGAGRGSNVYALVVDEFVEGPSKPFVFLENEVVYFGNCEHF
jgi:hypothetical protein